MLAVLGAATEEGITVRDASELRIKETDRIRTVVENLRRMGVAAEELPDGLIVPGRQKFHAAELDSFGDHRIAMAFAVAALRADGESVIHGAEAASVSFPEFWDTLSRCAQIHDQRIERDGLLNVPPHQLRDLVHLRHRLADPRRTPACAASASSSRRMSWLRISPPPSRSSSRSRSSS